MFQFVRSILVTGLMMSTTAALAGDLPPDVVDNVMTSCRPDYHRVCSYVVPGEGRAARCLLDHEAYLSPLCLKAVKIAYAIEACLPDYQRYCEGLPRGPRAVQCLAQRMDVLRPECQRVVAANEPYMNPNGDRYGYNGGGYNGGPVPYSRPDREPYGYEDRYASGDRYPGGDRDRYQDEQAYGGEVQPRQQPYGSYPYRENPQDPDRYADSGQQRFQPYGNRYGGPSYEQRGYGSPAPREQYDAEEEREPVR